MSQRRWFPFWLWILSLLWIFGAVLGCTGVTASAPMSAPLFIPTSEDAIRISTLTHELDTKALECMGVANCEQVYFARALVSLFENQEAARASFRHVIEHNPASPLATSSQLWLSLIAEKATGATSIDEQSNPSIGLVAQFVRGWLNQQVAEDRKDEKATTLVTIQDALAEQSRLLQVIKKQVRDRDRRIGILRSQLEALKLIDEDHLEKQRKVKTPASLNPTSEHVR